MRIAIYGTGGVGGYFGARLAHAGNEVFFVARGQHLEAMRQNGLMLKSEKGDVLIQPVHASANPADFGQVDLVLICTKTWQLPDVAQHLAPLLHDATVVVPLQNGVEAADQLAAVIDRRHIVGGIAKIFCYIAAPGVIEQFGPITAITLGEFDNRPSSRLDAIHAVLEDANITVERPDDMQRALWEKFMFVVSLGGVGSVTRMPIGMFRQHPLTRQMLRDCVSEIYHVGLAHGVALLPESIEMVMRFVDAQPDHATSSLQRDIIAGKPSELEAWNGAVVRLGQQVNVPTPTHSFIYTSLLLQEHQARANPESSKQA